MGWRRRRGVLLVLSERSAPPPMDNGLPAAAIHLGSPPFTRLPAAWEPCFASLRSPSPKPTQPDPTRPSDSNRRTNGRTDGRMTEKGNKPTSRPRPGLVDCVPDYSVFNLHHVNDQVLHAAAIFLLKKKKIFSLIIVRNLINKNNNILTKSELHR